MPTVVCSRDGCGVESHVKLSKQARAEARGFKLYCSQECSAARQRQRPSSAVCERCNEVFAPKPKTAGRFCTRECFLGSEDNPEARFWARVDKDGPVPQRHPELGNCWDWTGATEVQGYGRFRVDGKSVKAHRFSLLLAGGMLEGDQDALHHCDRRVCVRDGHLYAGTNKENQADVAEAGTRKGRRNNNAKLDEEQARAIKECGATTWDEYAVVGAAYGVHAVTVYEIIKGRRWTHL